jgi:hypothetical protein
MNDSHSPDRERDHHLWSAKKWSMVTPPMRPSARELAFTERELAGAGFGRGASALILGSTPELRSLALKSGLLTTGCDIDADFWRAMTLLRTTDGPEEFIHSNWLDIGEDRLFDIILADCALPMLGIEDCRRLVFKISGWLRDGGVSMQRIQWANESLTLDSIDSAMEAYREDPPGISLNLYLIFLCESLRNLRHPEMTNREFFESVVSPRLLPEEVERLRPFAVDRKFHYPRRDDLMALLESKFTIVSEERSAGPGVWDTASVVVLKNKDR